MALFIIGLFVVLTTAVFMLFLRLDTERQRGRRALQMVHQELADLEANYAAREAHLIQHISLLDGRILDLQYPGRLDHHVGVMPPVCVGSQNRLVQVSLGTGDSHAVDSTGSIRA